MKRSERRDAFRARARALHGPLNETPDAPAVAPAADKPKGHALKEPGRWDATRSIKLLREHWEICRTSALGLRERLDLDAAYAIPDAATIPDPLRPNLFSISSTLALFPELAFSFSPDTQEDNERVVAATLSSGIKNGAAIVKAIATAKFCPWAISNEEQEESDSDK